MRSAVNHMNKPAKATQNSTTASGITNNCTASVVNVDFSSGSSVMPGEGTPADCFASLI